jgi:membrane-associated phospholipid phosphatase
VEAQAMIRGGGGGSVLLALALELLAAGCAPAGRVGGLAGFAPRVARIQRERFVVHSTDTANAHSSEDASSWFRLASSSARESGTSQTIRNTGLSPAGVGTDDEAPPADGNEVQRQVTSNSRRCGPLPGFWETVKRDLREVPRDLWEDTKAVYTSGPNLLILGLAYGGSLAIQESGPDDTVEDSFRGGHRTFGNGWRDAFGAAGDPGTHFALAGLWYLVGQQSQDEKTYEVGKTLFSALAINGLSTLVGKAASWDDAPNGKFGAFPSGHTSSAFTVASVMHRAYGPWVGVPLYGLGALVAYQRLESNEHYLSDVVMGGVMGLVIGHAVAGEHEFELFGGRIVPYADPASGTSGVAWVMHFR